MERPLEPPRRRREPMRAALVGTGRIARQHLGCLAALPEAELVAVCDLSRAAAESAAERYGATGWYTDYAAMLRDARPEVVHVTTPAPTHAPLAEQALDAGAHVIVEKPAAVGVEAVEALIEHAERAGRAVVEDYNYAFNAPVADLLDRLAAGTAGDVVHVDVSLALDIRAPGGVFVDRNLAHPALELPGGAISDFVTHLASLAHLFVGAHRAVATAWRKRDPETPLPSDELRALVDGERGTATLSFSANAQPDLFTVRLETTQLRASANLFESHVSVTRVRERVPRPLATVVNGLAESRAAARGAIGGLVGKLGPGPGSYAGLWRLIAETYRALAVGAQPPVTHRQIAEVNRLVDALLDDGGRL